MNQDKQKIKSRQQNESRQTQNESTQTQMNQDKRK